MPHLPSPAWFLFSGIVLSLLGFPTSESLKGRFKKWGSRALQISIVLMGAKIPIGELITASVSGLSVTAISVTLILLTGYLLNRFFRLAEDQAVLISGGTAICGGSAIAAIAPTIKAKNIDVGIAIAVVFLLNAVALVLFPPIGRALHLSDVQFGTWAALAIHDTSSVVGAGAQWSEDALRLATTIKLSRTLWIFPIVLLLSLGRSRRSRKGPGAKSAARPPLPWFIAGFIATSLVYTYWLEPMGSSLPSVLGQLSVLGFSLALLFIGLSLSRAQLRAVSLRPVIFGITLWLITLSTSLAYVMIGL